MIIKVYWENELICENEIESVKEEFDYLRNAGYLVKVEGTI